MLLSKRLSRAALYAGACTCLCAYVPLSCGSAAAQSEAGTTTTTTTTSPARPPAKTPPRSRKIASKKRMQLAQAAPVQGVPPSPQSSLPPQPGTTPQGQSPGGAAESILVTGIRKSLQSAIDAKRKSDLIIESIAPEDVGKFPDSNVAESLQRLPGVQIDRSANGEGTAVLIDGLRYNLTTLNGNVFLTGREFYSSGESAGNGAGANVQYNSLQGVPSEEIGRINVYKTPKASMTEGGLGGTIDLLSRGPLDQKMGLNLAGNFEEENSSHQGGWTPNFTLVGGYKFSDHFAITASVSREDYHSLTYEAQDYNRNGWQINPDGQLPNGGPLLANQYVRLGQPYIEPQLEYFTNIDDEQVTIGSTFGAQWRVNDDFSAKFDWFFSNQDETNIQYANKLYFNGGNNVPGTGIDAADPYSIDSHGVVQNATYVATGAETATLYQHTDTQANNYQLSTAWDNGGPVRAFVNGAYSTSDYTSESAQADVEHGYYSAFTGTGGSIQPNAPGCNNGGGSCSSGNPAYLFKWANGGTSGLPSYSYLSPFQDVLSNPDYALFKSNWAWADHNTGQNYAARADVEYDPPFVNKYIQTTFTAGFRYGDREIDVNHGKYLLDGLNADGSRIDNSGGGPGTGPWLYYLDPGYAAIPYSTATSNPGLVQYVKSFNGQTFITKNASTLSNPATYLESVWTGAGGRPETVKLFTDPLSSFKVDEQTDAGYLMADFGGHGVPFHLNVGVRVVDTNLTINNAESSVHPTYYGTASWNGVDSNDVAVTHNRNYIDLLPSLNFVLDVTDTQKIRVSAARVVSPADLANLGLGNSYNFTRETGERVNVHTGQKDGFGFDGGTAGNANLDPYRATQFNISYENYFSPGSIASAEFFYKQVDSFEVTQNVPTFVNDDFGGTTANVSTPENAGHGQIAGLELGLQYLFNGNIVPFMKGFGFAGNYTYSSSTSDQVTSFSTHAPIPGVSRDAVSATAFYERFGFAARVSYTWRDRALNDGIGGTTFPFGGKTYEVFQAPFGELDMKISYDITPQWGVYFSAQNLTDEALHTYLQYPNLPYTYDSSGRRFFLGTRLKF